jgi:NAD(P)H dehydrogenase (quinone)
MYVITGATGHTGSIAARTLLEDGKKVRILARSAEKARPLAERGAEVVIGDLFDTKTLEKALDGATSMYLMSPPDMTAKDFVAERIPLLEKVVRTARGAKVRHVVLLSSIGAQVPSGNGPIQTLYAAEQALRRAEIPSTFVRASYFVENWAAVLPVAKKDGVLPTFLPAGLTIPMVSTPDIGRVVALALLEGPRGTRIKELGGPADASANDVAAVVSKILGRDIAVAEAPLDAVVPTFTSFGISANIAGLYRDMYEGMRSRKVGWEGGEAEAVRGSVPLEETLRQLLS